MCTRAPRVAFFPDTFYEINGVANTSRQFEAFAARQGRPFFCLRPGRPASTLRISSDGPITTLEIPRGSGLAIPLEKDLCFDPLFLRHGGLIARHLRAFRPDLIHITGPSEPGILGAWLAARLGVPLFASWHTNLHEYAARRSARWARPLLKSKAAVAERGIEQITLHACALFYRRARLLFAPNTGLCRLLEQTVHRPCALMPRGVDASLFSPEYRNRSAEDDAFVLGFCGRLSAEKNVVLLARIREQLLARGLRGFRFLIVGHGKLEGWLRGHLPGAEFTGVLHGHDLARAYANMDLFVFPSHTDTFGNVVLEAMSCGVPAVVTPDGGPASIVREGETGLIRADEGFPGAIASLMLDCGSHARMKRAARTYALTASWDSVFEGVYSQYERLLAEGKPAPLAAQSCLSE
jgi:glycosyltransferase involved in cell wall biosynthesis